MSRWAVLERLRGLGLAWAIPEVERRSHLAVMVREERAREGLVAAWVAVQLARNKRVAVLVKDCGEGRRLGEVLARWLPGIRVWVGAGEELWDRLWEEVRREEQVVVLTYYQFLNRVDRWPRWGFYAVVLWGVDCWLQARRLAVLDTLLDMVVRGRARVALCAVSPRLRGSWVAWLAQRFPFDEFGVLRPDDVAAPHIGAIDLARMGDEANPLDFVEDDGETCFVVSAGDVAPMVAHCARVGWRGVIRSFASEGAEAFRHVYLYARRLEFGDGELRQWARRVAPGGTLHILYDGGAFEQGLQPEDVVASVRRRLCGMAGFVGDGKEAAVSVQEFLVQFLRRVRFVCQVAQEIGETYLGARLGASFVARCLEQLEKLLEPSSGMAERPQYSLTQRGAALQSPIAGATNERRDAAAARENRRVVHSGWLRLTPLGREAAIQFRRLDSVAAVWSESRKWQTCEDLVAVLRAQACDSAVVEVLDDILEKAKRPPRLGTSLVDRRTVFRWRLLVAAFRTLHPRDERLPRLERVFLPLDRSVTRRRYRGLDVMAVLVPYLHALFLEGSVLEERLRPGVTTPGRCCYVHYRDLAQWLSASPDTVYRLLCLYLPSPTSLDLDRLKAHFARRGQRSLGIRLCRQVTELAAVVQHAYSRPTGSGRPRRVLVRLIEVQTGELAFPPGFVEGCRDCVAYAPHRRVCALAWHIVHQVGPTAVPPSLYAREQRCAPRASPCDCFAPRRAWLPKTLLAKRNPLPHEVVAGQRVVGCPISRCPGRILVGPSAHAGQCDACGCEVGFDDGNPSWVRVSANRRGFIGKMIEVLTGVRPDMQSFSRRAQRQLAHPLVLEPVLDYLRVERGCLYWRVHVSPTEVLDRSRSLAHTDLILAPDPAVSPAIQQELREAGVSVITYALANGRFPLTPDPVVISDLQWVRGNPLLLARFGTAVVLTALVTTAELALLFGFHVSKVETCLQRQIDAFTDFLRQGQFKTVQWMSVEGRIAWLQAALVREHLKALGEKELVAVRGRYLARKVPMEEGPVRASQSPFDEALNEGHRQIGWILRAENATAGLGYFTSGMLFFHQRVSGKSVHLDLDETARRVIDNQVLALFLAGNLTIKDFNRDMDAFGFPAYRAKATCVEAIHRAVDEVLQRPLRTAGQQRTLLDAHRSSLESLLSAARDHDIGKFSPLIYLPSDRLPRFLSTLAPLRNLAQHLRSRIDSTDPFSAPALTVTQALEMCEMMMS